uniref:TSA: Wollemia nobilis Ref_Wollemi_Transcript_5693_2745 transcribed RNA sequence n=1 Tax=Wollemia nobilis TaxID=56998 RepID=A0A0C9S864_9CONI
MGVCREGEGEQLMAAGLEVARRASQGGSLPPGFRFHPNDQEILIYYLKNKIEGKRPDIEVIREIDLYKCEPWDLPEKSILPTRDLEWYFFSPRDKKYPNGSRSNRATEKGYWKATGKDRKVSSQTNKIGMKKTLVFYKGRAPHGERTDWLMHEYRLDETQCKGAPHLQDLYVLCRVFRKGKQDFKNGEQYEIPSDEIAPSPSKSNSSPMKVNSVDEVEEQSEERCSPLIQEDDNQTTSGLRSETSSEILDNKTEDNVCLDGQVESLQGTMNQFCSFLPDNATGGTENVDPELWSQGLPLWDDFQSFATDPLCFGDVFSVGDVAQMSKDNLGPFYSVDFDEGYIEQADMQPDNDESYPANVDDGMPYDNVEFQFRPRPSYLQSNQQPLPSQGTAPRRILCQVQVTDVSADGNNQHRLSGHFQSKCQDDDSDDSDDTEVITEADDSALTSLTSQTSSNEEDDADSDILSTGGFSERSVKSVKSTGSEEKTVLSVTLDSAKSSDCGESTSAHAGHPIPDVQDNCESPQEQLKKPVGNGIFTPIIRKQVLMEEPKQAEKFEDTASESRSKLPNPACEFDDSSLKGEKLNSKKGSFALDTAANLDSVRVRAYTSHSPTMEETHTSCKESPKHAGFNLFFNGMKLRGKSRTKDTACVSEKKLMDATESSAAYSSKEGAKVFVNSGKAFGIFPFMRLLASASLVCFIWVIWKLARSSSAIIF